MLHSPLFIFVSPSDQPTYAQTLRNAQQAVNSKNIRSGTGCLGSEKRPYHKGHGQSDREVILHEKDIFTYKMLSVWLS